MGFERAKIDALRLARSESVGPITYRRLMARFDGDPVAALEALPGLAAAGGRHAGLKIASRSEAEREFDLVRKLGGRMIFLDDPDYPPYLAQLTDAPSVLAVLGDVSVLSERSVGIVGARNASVNGMRFSEGLAADLAERLVIVSGLARGIDAAAHKGAMRTGRTVAVVAGGIDSPYPPENAGLQAAIAETGAVVAEAPLGTAPMAKHFPKRNRIIAGLVVGLVVVEAAMRSGSLLTARLANEAGRELFAVPGGPLDPRSAGGNELIRQGAHLTETAADVFANLPDHPGRVGLNRDPLFQHGAVGFAEAAPLWETPAEDEAALRRAVDTVPIILADGAATVDEIARRCQLSNGAVQTVLLELELAGRVETLAGNRVCLAEDALFF
jgi:DNA processing protein